MNLKEEKTPSRLFEKVHQKDTGKGTVYKLSMPILVIIGVGIGFFLTLILVIIGIVLGDLFLVYIAFFTLPIGLMFILISKFTILVLAILNKKVILKDLIFFITYLQPRLVLSGIWRQYVNGRCLGRCLKSSGRNK